MVFNSYDFLIFFILFMGLYYVIPKRWSSKFITVSSYYFYSFWSTKYLSLILISSVVDFFVSRKLYVEVNEKKRKLLVLVSICVNLGILGYFKYCNFFIDSFLGLLNFIGLNPDPVFIRITLPVGISFYTFQTLGYTIDVYRRQLKPTNSFADFSAYVSFFPQLVAGPIERASDLLPQLQNRELPSWSKVYSGIFLCLWGLFKKIVIADNAAILANEFFNSKPNNLDSSIAIIGALAFTLQIYGDFSGYTDMARGVARLFGIELSLNFNRPYFASSIKDFWRRWHISLSTWLRDYLYISLGGSRFGTLCTYRNLFLTMLLGGLWHGASWMFVFWGAYHGGLLVLERLIPHSISNIFPKPIKIILTFILVVFGWVLFRADSIEIFNNWFINLASLNFSPKYYPLYLRIFILSLPILIKWAVPDEYFGKKKVSQMESFSHGLILLVIILLSFTFSSDQGREFIYFQF